MKSVNAEAASLYSALEIGKNKLQVDVNPEKVEEGLVKLVLSVVELLRQLLERQALRRMEMGSLSSEEVDSVGLALMHLDEQMIKLKNHFKLDDLNIDLGPLGNLLD